MYYEKIPKQKKSACKKSLLFDRKNTVFSGKSREKTILSGKIIWKNVIKLMRTSPHSYPAPCPHIDNQEYLRGVLLFEKLY